MNTPDQPHVSDNVRQKRRWPWFLAGALLAGGGAGTVAHSTANRIQRPQQPITLQLPNGVNTGTGSVGIWDEGTDQEHWEITVQQGTLAFYATHTLDEQLPSPDYRWTIGTPDDAPYAVNHLQDSWSQDGHGGAITGADLTITGTKCDDDKMSPLWITVSDPAGRTVASITAEVRIMCDHILTVTDQTRAGGTGG